MRIVRYEQTRLWKRANPERQLGYERLYRKLRRPDLKRRKDAQQRKDKGLAPEMGPART